MRKKIPTVTRADPKYAASLRQDRETFPEEEQREVGGRRPSLQPPAVIQPRPELEKDHAIAATQNDETPTTTFVDASSIAVGAQPEKSKKAHTRKIDIRVNALARQETALASCGVDPAHVIRAALRRAVKCWTLAPVFAPPSDERRTRKTAWQARTSLAVDGNALAALLRAHDPLDVLSKWALIRGQLEPCVWAGIDTILSELKPSTEIHHMDPEATGKKSLENR